VRVVAEDGCARLPQRDRYAGRRVVVRAALQSRKTALSIAVANSSSHMSIAPRGPRRVLCVVVEMTFAYPTGDGWAPPAIRPAMCAMSATRSASTSRAISANDGKSMVRGDRRAAAEDHLRALGQGDVAYPVHVDAAGRPIDAVVDRIEPLPSDRHRRAVREVATVRELQRQELVPGEANAR